MAAVTMTVVTPPAKPQTLPLAGGVTTPGPRRCWECRRDISNRPAQAKFCTGCAQARHRNPDAARLTNCATCRGPIGDRGPGAQFCQACAQAQSRNRGEKRDECEQCGADITARGNAARWCVPCAADRIKSRKQGVPPTCADCRTELPSRPWRPRKRCPDCEAATARGRERVEVARNCAGCGVFFWAARTDAIYHSKPCGNRHRYRIRTGQAPPRES